MQLVPYARTTVGEVNLQQRSLVVVMNTEASQDQNSKVPKSCGTGDHKCAYPYEFVPELGHKLTTRVYEAHSRSVYMMLHVAPWRMLTLHVAPCVKHFAYMWLLVLRGMFVACCGVEHGRLMGSCCVVAHLPSPDRTLHLQPSQHSLHAPTTKLRYETRSV